MPFQTENQVLSSEAVSVTNPVALAHELVSLLDGNAAEAEKTAVPALAPSPPCARPACSA